MSLKAKYLSGWLNPKNMKDAPNWLSHWTQSAEKAEAEGYELVVFKVPIVKLSETPAIHLIEELLQKTYGQ